MSRHRPTTVHAENSEERIARERDHHNRSFTDNRRVKLDRLYSNASAATNYYARTVLHGVSGRVLLEYGCGQGSMAFAAAEAGGQVSAIDISDVAVDLARTAAASRGLSIDIRCQNAEALQYPDESFDRVCGSGILHHLNVQRAYAEIARVLRKEGTAVFLEPLGHNPLINLYRRLTPRMRTRDEHPLLITDIDAAREHFASVSVNYFQLLTIAAVFLPGLRHPFERLDQCIFRNVRYLRRHAWIAVIVLQKS